MKALPACGGAAVVGALFTVDSFLLDPFLLFGSGFLWAILWEVRWKPRGRAWSLPAGLSIATVLCYWAVSLSLYFDLAWIDWLATTVCHAKTGRDWMLNSGLFHFDFEAPGTATHVVSALIFLTYPAWLALGAWAGSRAGRAKPPGPAPAAA